MADSRSYKPYVDPQTTLKELTLPPLILGALMAVVLGAANVYLGLKAGMTVAATLAGEAGAAESDQCYPHRFYRKPPPANLSCCS